MNQNQKQKIPTNPVCSKCGFPIIRLQKYLIHKDGTILCLKCYTKLEKEGKIK